MKKLFFVICTIIYAASMFAQDMQRDIIYKTNYDILEVKIIEVSDTEVKYKELDNLDGPTFVLPISEVGKIRFNNGSEKMYTVNGKSTLSTKTESNSVQSTQNITRIGQQYMYEGKTMRGNTYENFLRENCDAAYEQFVHGKKLANLGWAFFGFGLGLDITSIVTAINRGNQTAVTVLSLTGGAFEIACIPTLIVGYNNMHRSADTFNTTYKQQSQAYWSINVSQNSLGLALNF